MRQIIPAPTSFRMGDVLANSFHDFHAKGVDYVCLRRSLSETVKLYFFDGDVAKLAEVVHPHDHRYRFDTWVCAGAMQNVWYEPGDGHSGEVFNRFRYRSPLLNAHGGFEWAGMMKLREQRRSTFFVGDSYQMVHREIHTIRMLENETVLFLIQYDDEVPPAASTQTFCKEDVAPSLDGLYSRFTADQVTALLVRFADRTGIQFSEAL